MPREWINASYQAPIPGVDLALPELDLAIPDGATLLRWVLNTSQVQGYSTGLDHTHVQPYSFYRQVSINVGSPPFHILHEDEVDIRMEVVANFAVAITTWSCYYHVGDPETTVNRRSTYGGPSTAGLVLKLVSSVHSLVTGFANDISGWASANLKALIQL